MSPDRRLDDFDNERYNVNGFRLEIPHPEEIHQFIVNEANRRADTPRFS